MKKIQVLGVSALLVAGAVTGAGAELITHQGRVEASALLAGAGVNSYVVNVTSATDAGGDEIVLALFSFEDGLPAGTEVEVWPQIEGELPPWEVGGGLEGYGRNFWTMDDRTGTYVQFDVTKIVKAWTAGTIPNLGFVVRVLEDSDGQRPASGAVTAKNLKLTLYTEANDPPDGTSHKEEQRRKPPKVTEGGQN